ncbi:MAG TPA: DUF1634 domain-containing protein [Ktedonobacter sp.]|nr:DUF1634 domain-containing protein [Ktedonobacter sp.]
MQGKSLLSDQAILPHTSSTSTMSVKKKRDATSAAIGWILRVGVSVSASIMLLGLLLLVLDPAGLSARVFSYPHTLTEVWTGLLTLHPQAMMMVGLLLLVATPVFSVAAAAVAFALERDRLYVVIALIVLSILITSLLFGKGIG